MVVRSSNVEMVARSSNVGMVARSSNVEMVARSSNVEMVARSSNVENGRAQLKRRKKRNPLTESGMGDLACLLSGESGNTWT